MGYFEEKRKTAFYEYLFGRIQTMRYQIFSGAVFYDRIEHEDYTYKFNDALEFSCKNGVWYCRKLYFSRNKSQKLGSIIKNIDEHSVECADFFDLIDVADIESITKIDSNKCWNDKKAVVNNIVARS